MGIVSVFDNVPGGPSVRMSAPYLRRDGPALPAGRAKRRGSAAAS